MFRKGPASSRFTLSSKTVEFISCIYLCSIIYKSRKVTQSVPKERLSAVFQ